MISTIEKNMNLENKENKVDSLDSKKKSENNETAKTSKEQELNTKVVHEQPKELFYPKYLEKYKEYKIEHLHDKETIGKIERHNIESKELNNKRDIDVYLPPSYYKNPEKKYPVLYMHDGNNLFYPDIAFGGVPWKVDKTLEKLFEKDLIEEIIVVAIHNTIGRNSEYTWTEMQFLNKKEGGNGSKYAEFMTKTLKPFIDSKYRTLTDRNNTAVMGSSLGGLISFYLALNNSDTFGKSAIISPSFWWGNGHAFRDAYKIKKNMKLWIDMGYKEGKNKNVNVVGLHILNIRRMRDYLLKIGYQEGIDLGYLEDEEGHHNEHSWAKRFHLTMLFFFSKI